MNADQDFKQLIANQRRFFESGKTLPVAFRVEQLKRLKTALQNNESALLAALRQDLGKSDFEGYTGEVGFLYEEITHAIKHLRKWAKPRRVRTPLLHLPSSSWIHPQPKGIVLIMSPWNYPLQLILSPLVGVIAAGNCAILKPSEIAKATEAILAKIFKASFPEDYCAVITGGVDVASALLKNKFDHILFTGGTNIGRIVMKAAAEHLTPVTLELGGKSPCIVDAETNIEVSARRIVWGKFYNAGQTCVAPDYLLVHEKIKSELLKNIDLSIRNFFGTDPKLSPDYGRIISDSHFKRLTALLPTKERDGQQDSGERYIAPTIMDNAKVTDPVMQEEIFGPILPVVSYKTHDEAINYVKKFPNPLACYVFTNNKDFADRVIEEIPFGGGCVNNALVHVANHNLPFGGIGNSGQGAYHGKYSFETFSHMKAVMRTPFMLDLWLKYPPYKNRLKLIRKLMR